MKTCRLSHGILLVAVMTACTPPSGASSGPTTTGPTSASTTAPATSASTVAARASSASPTGVAGASSFAAAPADAAKLVKALAKKGYSVSGPGPELTAAVKSFQRDNGLAATGEADAAFWEAMAGTAGATSGAQGDAGVAVDTATVVTTATTAGSASIAAGERSATSSAADPAGGACASLFAQWDAAVLSGAKGSGATAQAAHDAAAAAGCTPNKWLPSNVEKTFVSGRHTQGAPCSMAEIANYDAEGLVCTQDVTDHPHWN